MQWLPLQCMHVQRRSRVSCTVPRTRAATSSCRTRAITRAAAVWRSMRPGLCALCLGGCSSVDWFGRGRVDSQVAAGAHSAVEGPDVGQVAAVRGASGPVCKRQSRGRALWFQCSRFASSLRRALKMWAPRITKPDGTIELDISVQVLITVKDRREMCAKACHRRIHALVPPSRPRAQRGTGGCPAQLTNGGRCNPPVPRVQLGRHWEAAARVRARSASPPDVGDGARTACVGRPVRGAAWVLPAPRPGQQPPAPLGPGKLRRPWPCLVVDLEGAVAEDLHPGDRAECSELLGQ